MRGADFALGTAGGEEDDGAVCCGCEGREDEEAPRGEGAVAAAALLVDSS